MGGPSVWQESQVAVKTVGISCAGWLAEAAWDGHAASRREKAPKINENKGMVLPPLRMRAPESRDKGLREGATV